MLIFIAPCTFLKWLLADVPIQMSGSSTEAPNIECLCLSIYHIYWWYHKPYVWWYICGLMNLKHSLMLILEPIYCCVQSNWSIMIYNCLTVFISFTYMLSYGFVCIEMATAPINQRYWMYNFILFFVTGLYL